jgi:protein-S-isoprenylcysteine O-methyltransferase Ste14
VADPHPLLVPGLWFAWLACWIVAARDAKPSERVESTASRLSHVLPLAFAFWLIWARSVPAGFLGSRLLPADSPPLHDAGVALLAAGLGFAIWARHWLGANWSGIVTLKQDHQLVRGGPYRWVRHPIYTGLLLGFLGTALARDQWRCLLGVGIAWLALWRKLRIEERWMVERFGDEYRRFRAEVPALIPNFRQRSGTTR